MITSESVRVPQLKIDNRLRSDIELELKSILTKTLRLAHAIEMAEPHEPEEYVAEDDCFHLYEFAISQLREVSELLDRPDLNHWGSEFEAKLSETMNYLGMAFHMAGTPDSETFNRFSCARLAWRMISDLKEAAELRGSH